MDIKFRQGVDPREGKYPGFRPNAVELVDGMEITRDVAIPMRDGITVYADIFRAEGSTKNLPTLLTWSPYGKHGLKTFDMFPGSGVPKGTVSRHAVWEGPDPLYWTKKGYAVVNGDARGSWGSEGDLEILGPLLAYDGYDAIEWIATQPWSNGRVGLAGVSYLAIVQWRIAQLNPPHLACINPWEGYTDAYRDHTHCGGIPETKFVKFTDWSCQFSHGKVENWAESQAFHELLDDYHESKRADNLSAVNVPAYVVADWGDFGLHTRGTLHGFTSIGSDQKWLEVHGQLKWKYYYQPSSLVRQEAFYQKFLKADGQPTEVDSWPRVRLEVRDQAHQGKWREENEWPLKRTRCVLKYLDGALGTISDTAVSNTVRKTYNSLDKEPGAEFCYTFTKETELTGSMRLRLWVSTSEGDDMDLFIQLDKLGASGDKLPFIAFSMFENGPLGLGWLRVSHRELDVSRSHMNQPWLQHKRKLPLRPGEIVPVDIEIVATSTRFLAGEQLKLTVQGTDIFHDELVPQTAEHNLSVNTGEHTIYTGGLLESYLVMPIIDK